MADELERDRDAVTTILVAFTERRFEHGKIGTAEAREVLKRGVPRANQVFFPSEITANLLSLARDEFKARFSRLGTFNPDAFQRQLEPYGLAGELLRMLHGETTTSALVTVWSRSKRVRLDDLPDTWWGDYTKREAILECALFEWFGWRPVWCQQGRHWFFADGHVRKHCRAHRRDGWNTAYTPKRKGRTAASGAKYRRRTR